MDKINIITLGCSKNLIDSEVLATHLKKNKQQIVFDSEKLDSNIVVINTCGFIKDAKEESIHTILDYANLKEQGKIDKLIVTGCLSQRYKADLQRDMPEVDAFFGVNDLPQILSNLKANYKKELYGERLYSTPEHYAFLKIAEGCDKKCSFCAIPEIRGKHISRPIEQIVSEANYLTKKGAKELLLISQDTSYYGKDLYNEYRLKQLLEKLIEIDELSWLRLHYLYPANNLAPIVDLMTQNEKICNYIDIPFQHVSDKILKSMHRGHNEKSNRQLIEMFRKKVPNGALRTTMIVGYPNETEADFKKLVDFVEEIRFDRLGVFTYSEEEGTHAASLKDDVPEEIKQERMDYIMDVQSQISLEKNTEKIGQNLKVLIDRQEGEYFIGRTEFDSPEVDNEVIIKSDNLTVGNFYNVKINSAEEFDLYGEVIK